MNEPGPDEAKRILIHIVTPVTASMFAYMMLMFRAEQYIIPEAVLLFIAGAFSLFYAFTNSIDMANQRLNDSGAESVES